MVPQIKKSFLLLYAGLWAIFQILLNQIGMAFRQHIFLFSKFDRHFNTCVGLGNFFHLSIGLGKILVLSFKGWESKFFYPSFISHRFQPQA